MPEWEILKGHTFDEAYDLLHYVEDEEYHLALYCVEEGDVCFECKKQIPEDILTQYKLIST